ISYLSLISSSCPVTLNRAFRSHPERQLEGLYDARGKRGSRPLTAESVKDSVFRYRHNSVTLQGLVSVIRRRKRETVHKRSSSQIYL
ncbi:MAG: hypothetical protein AAGI15_09725, partial [Pseudomonadota bacterium]